MFRDRKDAGQQLGEALLPYKEEGIIILAIPKGGVEIAYYVANALGMDFHIVVSRKLRHPNQPELAFGAIAEDKSLYLNPSIRAQLPKKIIEKSIDIENKEIRRQISKYREGQPLPDMKGKTVVVVDDGIATGSTLLVSIELCKKKGVGRLIVAVPVASSGMYQKLKGKVDELVVLETPRDFMAVSQAYHKFANLEDRDVLRFLKDIKNQRANSDLLSR